MLSIREHIIIEVERDDHATDVYVPTTYAGFWSIDGVNAGSQKVFAADVDYVKPGGDPKAEWVAALKSTSFFKPAGNGEYAPVDAELIDKFVAEHPRAALVKEAVLDRALRLREIVENASGPNGDAR
jgi:hypothetical protein